MANMAKAPIQEAPDQQKLSGIQAKRLSAYANVEGEKLGGLTIAQAADRLKWKIDPTLFLFRRICGKVVKKDPVTGEEYPVPYATVYVEDTDCHLVGYFPKPWPWGWFFPLHCHREVIGSTQTDQCGNFCVWIPRFDIDWIVKWRLERICFPIIFRRPIIEDVLSRFREPLVKPWPPIPDPEPWPGPWPGPRPGPGPDPAPLYALSALPVSTVEAIAGSAAGKVIQRAARTAQVFGSPSEMVQRDLNARLFETELPPPLPAEFRKVLTGRRDVVAAKDASGIDGVRSAVALKLGLEPASKELAPFDPRHYIGPFLRCYHVLVPEWQMILDVPDITFRVTQDTNGDGTQENIYSEGFFDVRWDSGPLPDVKLVASASARESHVCEAPDVPCGNVPAIVLAGFMPLNDPSYFDAATGYARRPNRPATGTSNPAACPAGPNLMRSAAQTPFYGTLNLFGCVNVGGAKYYRVLRSTGGGPPSAITGLAWNLYHTNGTPFTVAPDSNGWYAVLPNLPSSDPNYLWPEGLVLVWPTPSLGQSVLKIQTADAAKNHLAYSAPVALQSDNTHPTVLFTTLAWKFTNENDGAFRNLLGIPCPTIHRGSTPKDIEVLFEVHVSANHLRDTCIGVSGCGSGSFVHQSGERNHWHNDPYDNSEDFSVRYTLASTALEGAYVFDCHAKSRAMNPNGQPGGSLVPPDWHVDVAPIWVNPSIAVAVVNED